MWYYIFVQIETAAGNGSLQSYSVLFDDNTLMNQIGIFNISKFLQLFIMIPVILGAFYAAWRITGGKKRSPSGSGRQLISEESGLFGSRRQFIVCIVLTVLFTACLSYMLFSHLELQMKNPMLNRVLVWISGVFLAFFIFFLMALTATDLLCVILRRTGHEKLPTRFFMAFSVGIAVVLAVFGAMHARDLKTVYYEVSSEGRLSEPLRIVEVSDLHMGSVIGPDYVQHVVDAVNACHPDIVLFAGDQFNRTTAVDVSEAEETFEALSRIEASIGVYAVLGNHDPDLNTPIYRQFLSQGGITALDNGVLEIIPGNEDQPAQIHTLVSASADGLDSIVTPEAPADGAMILVGRTKLEKDPERVPLSVLLEEAGITRPDPYILVLDHDPKGVSEAASCDADLVVAGHTHRGQFFPATLVMQILYGTKYNYGRAQTLNKDTGHVTTSIVSSGAGYFQTPVRIGTDSEIVCIDIR